MCICVYVCSFCVLPLCVSNIVCACIFFFFILSEVLMNKDVYIYIYKTSQVESFIQCYIQDDSITGIEIILLFIGYHLPMFR